VIVAYSRPFWPLFLHVLGAMTLFGSVLTVVILAATAWTVAGTPPAVARAPFVVLLAVSIPAWVLMRADAQWIYSKEGWSGHNDPTWLGIGFGVADAGLVILLLTLGAAYWWRRSARALAGRIVVGLASVYLVLLAVAWLAMSGKWH
jgi:hypothetical protein